MSDHILVIEQLPPDDELVWAYHTGEGLWRVVTYSSKTGVWFDLKNKEAIKGMPYTHWMPMPDQSEDGKKAPPASKPA